jgi:hypothetical protein
MDAVLEPTRLESGTVTWLNRIRAEYREMPGLSLTQAQMQRLWGFEHHVCDALVDSLVAAQILRRTSKGQYVAFDGR